MVADPSYPASSKSHSLQLRNLIKSISEKTAGQKPFSTEAHRCDLDRTIIFLFEIKSHQAFKNKILCPIFLKHLLVVLFYSSSKNSLPGLFPTVTCSLTCACICFCSYFLCRCSWFIFCPPQGSGRAAWALAELCWVRSWSATGCAASVSLLPNVSKNRGNSGGRTVPFCSLVFLR